MREAVQYMPKQIDGVYPLFLWVSLILLQIPSPCKDTGSNSLHPCLESLGPCVVAFPLADPQVCEAGHDRAVLISFGSTDIVQTEQDQLCIESLSGTMHDKLFYWNFMTTLKGFKPSK